jgi:hypothetical protein
VLHLCEFYPGICLTTEEKSWKNLSQGKKNLNLMRPPTLYMKCASLLLTYLLTPWSTVLLEKLTVNFAASEEIPRIYGTRKFLTVPTSARHLFYGCVILPLETLLPGDPYFNLKVNKEILTKVRIKFIQRRATQCSIFVTIITKIHKKIR